MRKVFDYKEIAEVWIKQEQYEGKTRENRMFFEGDTIYSYGYHFPIARIDKEHGVILFTNKNYSQTTTGHKGYTHRAIGSSKYQDKIVFVNDPRCLNHRKYIDDLIDRVGINLDNALRRKKVLYIKENIEYAEGLECRVKKYVKIFPKAKKFISKKKFDEVLDWRDYVKKEVASKLIVHELSR